MSDIALFSDILSAEEKYDDFRHEFAQHPDAYAIIYQQFNTDN